MISNFHTTDNDPLIQAGHQAIANCIMSIISSPLVETPAMQRRLDALEGLQDKYYDILMDPLNREYAVLDKSTQSKSGEA